MVRRLHSGVMMTTVFRRLVTNGLSALLPMMLLLASEFDCTAKTIQPMGSDGCCKQGPCKKSPGTRSHSTCGMEPASADWFTLPPSVAHSSEVVLAVSPQALIPPVHEIRARSSMPV